MWTREPVALAFTDLVGSTALLHRLGSDDFDRFRREHFALLGGAARATGGQVVKSLGDGVMVAFSTITGAIDGAIAFQRAAARQRPPLADLQRGRLLKVGVSSGEATHERGDWYGHPVNEAARLCAHAAGGEILVPRHLAPEEPLEDGHAPTGPGRRIRAHGDLVLKGFPDSVPTCRVDWTPLDLAVDLPLPPPLSVPVDDDHRTTAHLLSRWAAVVDDARPWVVVVLADDHDGEELERVLSFVQQAYSTGASVWHLDPGDPDSFARALEDARHDPAVVVVQGAHRLEPHELHAVSEHLWSGGRILVIATTADPGSRPEVLTTLGVGDPRRVDLLDRDTERSLAERAVEGDQAALQAVLHRQVDDVYAVCLLVTGSPQQALDATQQTLSEVAGDPGWLGEADPAASVIGRAGAVALAATRREGAARVAPPQAILPLGQGDRPAIRLSTLDPEMRTVLVLRDRFGLSLEAIAAVLDVPERVVRTRVFRGRQALGGAGLLTAESAERRRLS